MKSLIRRPQRGLTDILLAGLALLMCVTPAAHAGLTINLQLYHNGTAYYLAFPSLNTNSASANPPDTGYFVWSHTSSANSGIHGEIYADGATGNGSGVYSDYAAFIPEITNSWTLQVTNNASTNNYTFYVTPFSSNSFPAVTVTFPSDGAVGITNQPTFTWLPGPTNYTQLFVQENDASSSFAQNAFLPLTQTSWTSPVALSYGSNYFFSINYNNFYDSNSTPTIAASTPTNNASQPFPGWVSTCQLSTYSGPSFTVTNPGAAGPDFNLALNTTGLVWTATGGTPWFVESTNTHDGILAAQGGVVTNTQISALQTTVTGPGTLAFWWQITANDFNFDLEFDIDGSYANDISGGTAWVQDGPYTIGPGSHTLRWIANAQMNNTDPADAAYLDQVSFIPGAAPVITVNPFNQTNYPGYEVALLAAATGSPAATWQWFKVGSASAIPGATNGLFIPTNSGAPSVAGSYYAVAGNSSGSAITLTAAVSFVSAPLPPEWSRAFKAPSFNNNTATEEYYLACAPDSAGNLYAVASFSGTNTFGSNTFTSVNGGYESVIVKQSAAGSLIWAVAITNNGSGSSFPQAVAGAPNDGLYVAGVFSGTNWLGANRLVDTGGDSIYLARFDAGGNNLWVRTITSVSNIVFTGFYCLASDPAGNVTLSGLISGSVIFSSADSATTNVFVTGQQGTLAQYDANGALRWVQVPGAYLNNLTFNSGRIYGSMGNPGANFTFGGVTNATDRAKTLAALNASNGQVLWLRGLGAPFGQGNPLGIADDVPLVTVSGTNLFVVGTAFGSNAAFGPYTVSWPASSGQYFARYDTNGNPQLATAFGSPSTLAFSALADASGNVYVGGDFDTYAFFGNAIIAAPHLDSIGNGYYSAGYLAKFDRNGAPLWVRLAQSQSGYVNSRALAPAPDGIWACGFLKSPSTFGPNTVYSSFTCLGTPLCTLEYHTSGFLTKITESTSALPVTLFNPRQSGANFSFQFLSQAGHIHTILSRTNVAAGPWQTNSSVSGDGATKTITIPMGTLPQQYFRVGTQ